MSYEKEFATAHPLVMAPYLIIPGWGSSGPDHWQTHWERELAHATRVQMPDWIYPRRAEWVGALDRAIRASAEPPILIAHSLGCLAVAAWAARAQVVIRGAMLVAPPDVDRADAPVVLQDFGPVPREPLPFPSIVVASDNDRHASLARVARMARELGSQLTVMTAAGHINRESGFGPWPDGRALLRYFHAPSIARDDLDADDAQWICRGID
jgi:predicted alpha/beta hydrolase family esterase